MCGIMGYSGTRPAAEVLMKGLKSLEYRGYDSAGIALLRFSQPLNDNPTEPRFPEIVVLKAGGKLENVQNLLTLNPLLSTSSTCGIGHTRWATHGQANTQNAHPHQVGHLVLVHNGIIENYSEIRHQVLAQGFKPLSETDTELFGFLIFQEMEAGFSLKRAVQNSFKQLRGQCSVLVMSEREPGTLVGIRQGSPLLLTQLAGGDIIFASDPQPLTLYSQNAYFLEHNDLVVAKGQTFEIYPATGGSRLDANQVQSRMSSLHCSVDSLEKGVFPHFMLKEIYEQPRVLRKTLLDLLETAQDTSLASDSIFSFKAQPALELLVKAQEMVLLACGSSWHSALLGQYWIEQWAQIPVRVELSSEFRYRQPIMHPQTVVIGISQSGETADTLAALREIKKKGFKTLGISNVRGSSLSREVTAMLYLSAGPEMGVAATKTFLAQMLIFALIAGYLGKERGAGVIQSNDPRFIPADLLKFYRDLLKIPELITEMLGLSSSLLPVFSLPALSPLVQQIQKIAIDFGSAKSFFFIGRGYSLPIALEGALKLKEIAYDHAEGYAAGELKHGPIAMIDSNMVVVVLAPKDRWREKTLSNLAEVKARGASILGIGNQQDLDLQALCHFWIPLPEQALFLEPSLFPFILTPILQLFSYYRAVFKGTDVDKPRNLAKCVTVE